MTINVLIGGPLPRLLRDIVQVLIHREPDIHVATLGNSATELMNHIDTHSTDVVIVGCDQTQMEEVSHSLLDHTQHPKVIAVTAMDCDAVLYRLTPVSQHLGRLSTDSLLQAIRGNDSTSSTGLSDNQGGA